jgi:hypothetical protein
VENKISEKIDSLASVVVEGLCVCVCVCVLLSTTIILANEKKGQALANYTPRS